MRRTLSRRHLKVPRALEHDDDPAVAIRFFQARPRERDHAAENMHGTGAIPDIADGPYRTVCSTVAQARWRDWRTILFFATVVAGMWLLCLSVRTTFACDREAGRCSLQTHTALGTTERVIPLASVTGAALAPFPDSRCQERECPLDVRLFTTAGEIRLPSTGSDVELFAFNRAVNQFVRTRDARTLAVAYGSVWRRCEEYAPIFVLLLVGCLFVRPGVRVTSNQATQRLVFEIRALGPMLARKRTYDLATVQVATVLTATARSHRPRYSRASVQLVMRDASSVDVPVSGGSPRGCQAIVDKINAVLGRPPS